MYASERAALGRESVCVCARVCACACVCVCVCMAYACVHECVLCVCMDELASFTCRTLTCEVVDKLACQFGGNPPPCLSSMGASDLKQNSRPRDYIIIIMIGSTHSKSYALTSVM